MGRQPAIPRSLGYRTILYKTTFVLDKLLRHVSDKNYELLYSVKALKYIFDGEAEPRVGLANISYT